MSRLVRHRAQCPRLHGLLMAGTALPLGLRRDRVKASVVGRCRSPCLDHHFARLGALPRSNRLDDEAACRASKAPQLLSSRPPSKRCAPGLAVPIIGAETLAGTNVLRVSRPFRQSRFASSRPALGRLLWSGPAADVFIAGSTSGTVLRHFGSTSGGVQNAGLWDRLSAIASAGGARRFGFGAVRGGSAPFGGRPPAAVHDRGRYRGGEQCPQNDGSRQCGPGWG